jgi:hypothetical protein
LILHEDHDQQRTLPLVNKLRTAGILRNPPVVFPLGDGTQRYMVLDGANRVTALQEMEFPHIVAQVAGGDHTHVALQTWNHVVWGMPALALLHNLRLVTGLQMQPIDLHKSVTPPAGAVVHIRLASGEAFMAEIPITLREQVMALHGIVDSYKEHGSLDRTSQTRIDSFERVYSGLTALVIFPRFEIQAVLKLAGEDCLLPTGITRFTVSPRALHLNYPLHELSSGKPLEYKEAFLQQWIEDRAKTKGIRYYAEATFLYDE